LTINDVVVRVLTGHEKDEDGHQYRFRCPTCKEINLKTTSLHIITMLSSAGARKEEWDLPLEIMERPESNLAPITLDDVIDLHMELENDEEWMKKIKGEQ
jgi:hypothetical protein